MGKCLSACTTRIRCIDDLILSRAHRLLCGRIRKVESGFLCFLTDDDGVWKMGSVLAVACSKLLSEYEPNQGMEFAAHTVITNPRKLSALL